MSRTPATEKRLERPRAARSGRPPRELAGEVDARILEAAHRVFLERGLAGASMEEIAEVARAGKPTIYARFSSKEALFTAVVARNVEANIARFQGHVPIGADIEERLANLGATILHWVLAGDTIGLIRLAIAEASRFPDLASSVKRMARDRAAEAVAKLLSEVAQSDELGSLPAFAPENLTVTTRFFLDLAILPLIMEALYGVKLKALQAEIGPHVARSIAFFLAGCRRGGAS